MISSRQKQTDVKSADMEGMVLNSGEAEWWSGTYQDPWAGPNIGAGRALT